MTELFDKAKYDALEHFLTNTEHAVIVSHINPDGDAIGSSLGLACLLRQRVKKVSVVMPNRFPSFLEWIEGASDISIYSEAKNKATELIRSADLVFCLDFNHLNRIEELGLLIAETSAPRILIDHHLNPADEFSLQFSHVPISSTSELVYRISAAISNSTIIPKAAAEAIYCGIMTDTGSFAHSSSDPELFRIVANLLECGIDKDKISHRVYNNFTADRMKLLGYSLNEKMVVLPKYKTAYISLTQNELKQFNFQPGDTEGFVNLPLSIKGVILSIFLVESAGFVKLSIRTQGNFSANDLSNKYFNGGGHKNAAGGKLFCSITEAVEFVNSILPKYEKELQLL